MLNIKLWRATSKPSEHSLMFYLIFAQMVDASSQGSWWWRVLITMYVIFNVPRYFFSQSANRVLHMQYMNTQITFPDFFSVNMIEVINTQQTNIDKQSNRRTNKIILIIEMTGSKCLVTHLTSTLNVSVPSAFYPFPGRPASYCCCYNLLFQRVTFFKPVETIFSRRL